jgi:hypothetical protein
MATPERRSSREILREFDESIFKPKLEQRLELPADEDIRYEEVQPFDQIWLWIMIGFEFAIMLIALLVAGTPLWTAAIGIGAMTLTMALLGSLKLYTRIDADGVHYRMFPFHFREQTLPWEEVDQIHVRQYSPILEYGGWGIRYGRNGKAFNVRGNYGIQIVKKNGKRLLIGTQRPDEAARHLAMHPVLV